MSSLTVFLDKVESEREDQFSLLSETGSAFLAVSLDFLVSVVFLLLAVGFTSMISIGAFSLGAVTAFFRDDVVVFLAGAGEGALEVGVDLGASATTGSGAGVSSFLVTGAGEDNFSLAGLGAFLADVLGAGLGAGAGAGSGLGSATLALAGDGAFSFAGAGAGATTSSLLETFNFCSSAWIFSKDMVSVARISAVAANSFSNALFLASLSINFKLTF